MWCILRGYAECEGEYIKGWVGGEKVLERRADTARHETDRVGGMDNDDGITGCKELWCHWTARESTPGDTGARCCTMTGTLHRPRLS